MSSLKAKWFIVVAMFGTGFALGFCCRSSPAEPESKLAVEDRFLAKQMARLPDDAKIVRKINSTSWIVEIDNYKFLAVWNGLPDSHTATFSTLGNDWRFQLLPK